MEIGQNRNFQLGYGPSATDLSKANDQQLTANSLLQRKRQSADPNLFRAKELQDGTN